MRKMIPWTPQEASTVYWLTLWGYSNKEIMELSKDVLTDRSPDGIQGYITDARKYITELKKLPLDKKAPPKAKALFKAGSKIPPVKEILTMKPDDLSVVVFKPAVSHLPPVNKKVANPIHYEQVDSNPKKVPTLTERLARIKAHEIPNKPLQAPPNTILGDPLTPIDHEKEATKQRILAAIAGETPADKIAKRAEEPVTLAKSSLEEVLKAAQRAGAIEVHTPDYVIIFKHER